MRLTEPLYCPNRVTHSSIKPFGTVWFWTQLRTYLAKSRFAFRKEAQTTILWHLICITYTPVSTVIQDVVTALEFLLKKKVDGCQGTFDGPVTAALCSCPVNQKRRRGKIYILLCIKVWEYFSMIERRKYFVSGTKKILSTTLRERKITWSINTKGTETLLLTSLPSKLHPNL